MKEMKEMKESKYKEYKISDLMNSAEVLDNPDIYINHARFMVTSSEIVIDLYKISPLQGEDLTVKSERVQRLFLPHSLGKGFVEGLANAINNFEEDNNVKLINSRARAPRDKIKVWDDDNNK